MWSTSRRRLIVRNTRSRPLAMPTDTQTVATSWIPRINRINKSDLEDISTQTCPTEEFASDVDSLATSRINAGIDPSVTKNPEIKSTRSMNPTYQEIRMDIIQKMTPTSKNGINIRMTGRLENPPSGWNPNGPGKAEKMLMPIPPSEKRRVLKQLHTAGDQPELLDLRNLSILSPWKLMNQNPRSSRDQKVF